MHALWLAVCDGHVGMANASKKSSIFLLEAILVSCPTFLCARAFVLLIATARAFDAEGDVIIEQDGQIGLKIAAEDFVHLQHRLRAEFAASALVSLGRIGETIAEHDSPLSERGQNDLLNMLSARRKH